MTLGDQKFGSQKVVKMRFRFNSVTKNVVTVHKDKIGCFIVKEDENCD